MKLFVLSLYIESIKFLNFNCIIILLYFLFITIISNLAKGKELIKTDIVGKSDPYAQIQYGNQKFKTKTVNNTQVIKCV